MNEKPNTITFKANDSTWVMRITADRKIEVNEDIEVSTAAWVVFNAVQELLKPREWVGLTDAERDELFENATGTACMWSDIEAKLKEKNHA